MHLRLLSIAFAVHTQDITSSSFCARNHHKIPIIVNNNNVPKRRCQKGHHHAARVRPTTLSAPSSTSAVKGDLSMKVKIGIVGLPNVGKSTLFNALARESLAQSANYPFCTIDPNVAQIPVPDAHLEPLGKLANSLKTVPATMEFVDVAGLVSGASRGEGLGNRFLATIRECDAICHLIRSFEVDNGSVVHVDGRVDPIKDAEVVNLELLLADVAHIERRLEKSNCQGEERAALEKLIPPMCDEGIPARAIGLSPSEHLSIKSMGLLTLKPVLYVFNVDDADFLFGKDEARSVAENALKDVQYCDLNRDMISLVSAKLEAEASQRTKEEQIEYLNSLGVDASNERELEDIFSYGTLPTRIRKLLHLSLLYTRPGVPRTKSRTTKAHLFRRHAAPTAYQMAGRLHGTIQKGFVKAEVVSAEVLEKHGTYAAAKEAGDVRTEGKDYVMNDDDVLLVKWK